MAVVELNLDLSAQLHEEGVSITVYLSEEDNEVQEMQLSYDELLQELLENVDDKAYLEKVAKNLAEMSKDIFCKIG